MWTSAPSEPQNMYRLKNCTVLHTWEGTWRTQLGNNGRRSGTSVWQSYALWKLTQRQWKIAHQEGESLPQQTSHRTYTNDTVTYWQMQLPLCHICWTVILTLAHIKPVCHCLVETKYISQGHYYGRKKIVLKMVRSFEVWSDF